LPCYSGRASVWLKAAFQAGKIGGGVWAAIVDDSGKAGGNVGYVPDARVLFGGDLLWKDHVPNLVDASTDKWIAILSLLSKDYAGSTFVPGHGEVANPNDVAVFKD
jgi:hypothetical protein